MLSFISLNLTTTGDKYLYPQMAFLCNVFPQGSVSIGYIGTRLIFQVGTRKLLRTRKKQNRLNSS